jgi:hypothetical protein
MTRLSSSVHSDAMGAVTFTICKQSRPEDAGEVTHFLPFINEYWLCVNRWLSVESGCYDTNDSLGQNRSILLIFDREMYGHLVALVDCLFCFDAEIQDDDDSNIFQLN